MLDSSVNAIATLGLLLLILLLDFLFRRSVYNRSDPLSLTLLIYSFLLIGANTLFELLHQTSSGSIIVNPKVLTAYLIYFMFAFLVFLVAKASHMNFRYAQEQAVKDYLMNLSSLTPAPKSVWRALEILGAETIEPDVFRLSIAKREKRIEYLRMVSDLTGASVDPILDQEKLLVKNTRVHRFARLTYVSAFLFSVLSILYFFSQK